MCPAVYSNEHYSQLHHNIKVMALWEDNVQRSYGEVAMFTVSNAGENSGEAYKLSSDVKAYAFKKT